MVCGRSNDELDQFPYRKFRIERIDFALPGFEVHVGLQFGSLEIEVAAVFVDRTDDSIEICTRRESFVKHFDLDLFDEVDNSASQFGGLAA